MLSLNERNSVAGFVELPKAHPGTDLLVVRIRTDVDEAPARVQNDEIGGNQLEVTSLIRLREPLESRWFVVESHVDEGDRCWRDVPVTAEPPLLVEDHSRFGRAPSCCIGVGQI